MGNEGRVELMVGYDGGRGGGGGVCFGVGLRVEMIYDVMGVQLRGW